MQQDNIIINSQVLLPEAKQIQKFNYLLGVQRDPKTIKSNKELFLVIFNKYFLK